MENLEIPKKIFEQMVNYAKAQAPVESCGILAGSNGKVQRFYEMINTDNSTDHFMMAPQEQFKAVKDIRSSGLEMLAIYHSHPVTPARPSAEDIRLALTPDVVYVILSLKDSERPDVKGFRIENGSAIEFQVTIVENKHL